MKTTSLLTAATILGSSFTVNATSCTASTVTKTVTVTSGSASPTSTVSTTSNFGLMMIASGSGLQYAQIDANGGKFWVGKKTKSYCPESVGSRCPAGNLTLFEAPANGAGILSLSALVPAGQTVYVGEKGALKYTLAHEHIIPNGSYADGFSLTPGNQYFNYLVQEEGNFFACKVAEEQYQIFVNVPAFKKTGCIKFGAAAVPVNATGAWEYI